MQKKSQKITKAVEKKTEFNIWFKTISRRLFSGYPISRNEPLFGKSFPGIPHFPKKYSRIIKIIELIFFLEMMFRRFEVTLGHKGEYGPLFLQQRNFKIVHIMLKVLRLLC